MDDAPIHRLTVAELVRRGDFALGAATVSPATRVIRGPGGEATLEPRAMQVLVTLAEAEGGVVTRDEIFRRCWGAAIVGDDSLNRAVADIRRVARTVAAGAFEIETVPRTGYRLVSATRAGVPPPAGLGASSPRRRLLLAGAAALAASMVGAGVYGLAARRRGGSRVEELIAESDQAMRTAMPEGSERAVELLEEAVALQPRDATAWGRLALAHASLADVVPPGQAPANAAAVQQAARRAMSLRPRHADAMGALAILPPYYGDWLNAERRMAGVLSAHPDHLPTLDALSFLHVSVDRGRESSLRRLKFSPREPLHAGHQYRTIYAHWILGQMDAADRAADRALQLWPRHPAPWFARLWVLAFTGRAGRALAHLDDAAARPDLPPWMLDMLRVSMSAMVSRRPADRARAVESLVAVVSRGPSLSVNAILLLCGLDEVDRAFDVAHAYYLEEGRLLASIRWRAGQMAVNDQRRRKTGMIFVPVSANMRADPRFTTLVQRMGLADYWARARVTPDFLADR